MKYLWYTIVSIALLASGCTETDAPVEPSDKLTFCVMADAGFTSRSLSISTDISRLRYGLYTSDGKLVDSSDSMDKSSWTWSGLAGKVSFENIPEGSYTLFLWADTPPPVPEEGYIIDFEDATLTVDYGVTLSNPDYIAGYDAFMSITTFDTSAPPTKIKLTRPLCLVCIGTDESWIKSGTGPEMDYDVSFGFGKDSNNNLLYPNKLNILSGKFVPDAVQSVCPKQNARSWRVPGGYANFPFFSNCHFVFAGYILCPEDYEDWLYDSGLSEPYIYRYKYDSAEAKPYIMELNTGWGIGGFWCGLATNSQIAIVPGCVDGSSDSGLFDFESLVGAKFRVHRSCGYSSTHDCFNNNTAQFENDL